MTDKWQHRFFTIWSAQALSLFGSELVQFALIWWLTSSTGSATVLATASMIGLLPQIVIGPFAGVLVDRWDRRKTMIFADGAIALATLALAIIYASGRLQPWHIYVLMFVRSTGGGFQWPAMSASTTLMVPEKHLSRVAGMNQTLRGLCSIAMPPLGALLLSLMPMGGILLIDVATAAIAIVPLLFFTIPHPVRDTLQPLSVRLVLEDMRDGLRYLAKLPAILTVMIVSVLMNITLTPAFSLTPLLITQHHGGGAMQIAWFETAAGLGMLAGGLLLSAWGGFKRRMMTMLFGLLGLGLGCLVIGFAPATALIVSLVGAIIIGIALPIVDGPYIAMLQAMIAPNMQGRIFSLASAVSKLATPIGLAIAGPVADTFGIPLWFRITGTVGLVLAAVSFAIPGLRHLEAQEAALSVSDEASAAAALPSRSAD